MKKRLKRNHKIIFLGAFLASSTVLVAASCTGQNLANAITQEQANLDVDNVQLSLNNKGDILASSVTITSAFTKSNFEEGKYDLEIKSVTVSPTNNTQINVVITLKEKNSTIVSKERTITITGFKMPPVATTLPTMAEANTELAKVSLNFINKTQTLASTLNTNSTFSSTGFDPAKYELEIRSVVVSTESNTSVNVKFVLKVKGSQIVSNEREVTITGFKMPPVVVLLPTKTDADAELAKVMLDFTNKSETLASTINVSSMFSSTGFDNTKYELQIKSVMVPTETNTSVVVKFTLKVRGTAAGAEIVSNERDITITGFKTPETMMAPVDGATPNPPATGGGTDTGMTPADSGTMQPGMGMGSETDAGTMSGMSPTDGTAPTPPSTGGDTGTMGGSDSSAMTGGANTMTDMPVMNPAEGGTSPMDTAGSGSSDTTMTPTDSGTSDSSSTPTNPTMGAETPGATDTNTGTGTMGGTDSTAMTGGTSMDTASSGSSNAGMTDTSSGGETTPSTMPTEGSSDMSAANTGSGEATGTGNMSGDTSAAGSMAGGGNSETVTMPSSPNMGSEMSGTETNTETEVKPKDDSSAAATPGMNTDSSAMTSSGEMSSVSTPADTTAGATNTGGSESTGTSTDTMGSDTSATDTMTSSGETSETTVEKPKTDETAATMTDGSASSSSPSTSGDTSDTSSSATMSGGTENVTTEPKAEPMTGETNNTMEMTGDTMSATQPTNGEAETTPTVEMLKKN